MPNFSFYGDVSDVKISFYLSELGYGSLEVDSWNVRLYLTKKVSWNNRDEV